MTIDTYKVTLANGETFWMRGNMVDASAPITVCFHDREEESDWQSTPWQTGDCRHDAEEAAETLAIYFADESDCTDVALVEAI